ncbi:hypothetical protein M9H77_24457 [Catharanthus roseus]|uniref:Uncharacterized protein n=1 Tax=Catharanthus roseus TaxID=4058 RepID=A0ACC0AX70_CATRO|nr:hypothetical protein M9H77_24457 [Catharanthus roseus]
MKKNQQLENEEQDLEIIKAVAQAWHGHSGSSRTTSEFDANRQNFKARPSRFKIEAMNNKVSSTAVSDKNGMITTWDFGQSLWDSYEIVAVSKKLEAGLVLDHKFSVVDEPIPISKGRKESKNSLRNLFNKMSSRRFDDADIS